MIKNWEQLKGISEENAIDSGRCEQQLLNVAPHRQWSREQEVHSGGALAVPRGPGDSLLGQALSPLWPREHTA